MTIYVHYTEDGKKFAYRKDTPLTEESLQAEPFLGMTQSFNYEVAEIPSANEVRQKIDEIINTTS